MSDHENASVKPTPIGNPPPRNGCLTAIMAIVGIILLLPGLCALIFSGLALSERSFPSEFAGLILVGLLVGVGGGAMLWAAIRGPRR